MKKDYEASAYDKKSDKVMKEGSAKDTKADKSEQKAWHGFNKGKK